MAPARGRRLFPSAAVAVTSALFLCADAAPSVSSGGSTPFVPPMWCSVMSCAEAGAAAECLNAASATITCAEYAAYEGVCGDAAVACLGADLPRPPRCSVGDPDCEGDAEGCAAAAASCLHGFEGAAASATPPPPSRPSVPRPGCVDRPADGGPVCPTYRTCMSAADCGKWAGAAMACVAPAGERQCTPSRCRQMAEGGLGCKPAGACTRDCRPGGYCTPLYC